MTPTRTFLTVAEMAAYLGVSHKTIYRRLDAGLIFQAPLGSGAIRIPASELDRFSGIEPIPAAAENSND